MRCLSSSTGALFCLGSGAYCVMAGPCPGLGRKVPDSMVQLTILEDSPVLARGGSARVLRSAGPVAVGSSARRIAGAGMESNARILFTAWGYHGGGVPAFKTRTGDGFAIRREGDGRGARIEVLALEAGRLGRTLARERLDADDALVVRVPFEGRTRVLVLQAATLPTPEAEARATAAQREIRESMPAPLAGERPPFELIMLDR
ncbi:MAG TPA: hypothetical protein VMS88_00975 [Terriglobales bacterium]|nr:hypothetical protein [Terriglobales bacterium]